MKIEITKEILQNILSSYGIDEKITEFSHFITGDNGEGDIKYITSVTTERGRYVVKLVRQRQKFKRAIEDQCVFSEYLRNNGILTPRHYTCRGRYRTDARVGEYILNVTVEDYIGEEMKLLTAPLARRIGELMGKMHTLSERGNCHIYRGEVIFNLVGYNEVNGYNSLLHMARAGKLGSAVKDGASALARIKRANSRIMRAIRQGFTGLPVYAVQGDISINNLTLVDGELAVFDYNIAGDLPLLSDMILEGLLTAHEMDREDGLTVEGAYSEFESGYFSVRPLTDAEAAIYKTALDYSEALWFSKISEYFNGSVGALQKNGDTDGASRQLESIASSLEAIEA